MDIQSSTLLTPVSKGIQVYNGCLIANEGPVQVAKLGLGNLNIPYDSIFTSRMTLVSEGTNKPIMYGFLGTNITFLTIKVTYTFTNPQTCQSKDLYLEYFFEDEPLIVRTFTDLLVLSGNKDHRIPQVYLYNPTEGTVTVDIMMANLDPNEITTALVPEYSEIMALAFSDITSDQIYGLSCTGSTQFEILNFTGQTQMVIPYNHIDLIQINGSQLIITTNSEKPVKLTFVSEFQAYQAFSRMNWVREATGIRYLTRTYPGLDTTPPSITFKPVVDPQPMTLGTIITKADIRWQFINTVVDYDNLGLLRDGAIAPANVGVFIINQNTGEQLTAITRDGYYAATFQAKDVAGNSTSVTKNILVDSLAPIIYYTTGITLNLINLTGDCAVDGLVTVPDLRQYYLDHVWDDVDGIINNSSVNITIVSGSTTYTGITRIGYYTLTFDVADRTGNHCTGGTLLRVTETVPPVITWTPAFAGATGFTLALGGGTGITVYDVIDYTILSINDNYDGPIVPYAIANTLITGPSFPLTATTQEWVTFSVTDTAGNNTSAQTYMSVI